MNYLRKFLTQKKLIIIAAIILSGFSFFIVKQALAAGIEDSIGTAVVLLTSSLIKIIIDFLGTLLLIAIAILIRVCGFNEFVDADIVTIGWVIIRDLANLGIVIAMLIIAFGTTLNKNSYSYKTLLPKLIIAAILINFSKSITGALISLSQYIMMYFVHAFENIAAGNITYGFGIEDMLSVRKAARNAGAGAEINDWSVLGAMILAVIMLAVALGVVITMALMLLYRIIFLWLLIIFSPLYFVADVVPGLKKYSGMWRQHLGDNLTKGPALAFMFWLSMTFLTQITDQNRAISLSLQAQVAGQGSTGTTDYAFFASKMSSPQRVFDYLVTVVLFWFTMTTAKSAGGMAGSFASSYMGRLNKMGNWIKNRPGKIKDAAWKGVKKSAPSQYLAGAVGGVKGRILDTKLAKFLGANKEYSEQKAIMAKARGLETFGGAAGVGAVREAQYRQAKKKQKEMEERGQLEGGDDSLRQLLKGSLDSGDLNTARALMLKIASSKNANLRTEDLEAYRKAIGVEKENSGSRKENDYMAFMEELKDMQKGSGDTMADFKFGIKRDSTGKLVYQDNLEDAVRETFSKKREADFNDSGLLRAFDEEKPEFLAILDELYNKKNMKALGQDGRDAYAKIIQRVLAKNTDGTLDLSDEQKNKYEVLLERMTAKRFERDTGEAILKFTRDMTTGKRIESAAYTSIKSNPNKKEEVKAMDAADQEYLDLTDAGALDQILQGARRKKNEKQREDLLYGRETPSEFDEDLEKSVLRPTIATKGSVIIPQIYTTVNEGRDEDFVHFHSRVSKNVGDLYLDLLAKVQSAGVSEIVNPDTGTNYTYEEIFENSDMGKTLKRLNEIAAPESYLTLPDSDQKKYRQETEFLLDKLKFLTERAGWNAGESTLGREVGKKVKNRTVDNRIVNRDEISGAKSMVRELQNANLTGQEREKKLDLMRAKLEKALKHSQKNNPDQLFVDQLSKLVSGAQTLDVGTKKEDLEKFIGQIDIVLKQVQAK